MFRLTAEEKRLNKNLVKLINESVSDIDAEYIVNEIANQLSFMNENNSNLTTYCNLSLYVIYYFTYDELRSGKLKDFIFENELIKESSNGSFIIESQFYMMIDRMILKMRQMVLNIQQERL